jgi:hypothetical protein
MNIEHITKSERKERSRPPETEAGPIDHRKAGYGQPPVGHQFKPGQSGNPGGRRKLIGDFARSLRLACDQPIRVTNARRTTLPQIEATLLVLIQKALKGSLKSLLLFLKIGVKVGAIKPYQMPYTRGGVILMPMEFFYLPQEQKDVEIEKEIARRNAMLARGLPYDRTHANPHGVAGSERSAS